MRIIGAYRGPDCRPACLQRSSLLLLPPLVLPRPDDPRLELLLERPLLPLLLRDEPELRLPPRSRLLSDWLRDDPPLPRDELPDPDDLFDWFAMTCSS
jgi:hypothetical protein